MSFIKFNKVGSLGVIKDVNEHEVPPDAWTDAQNIRFLDGYAQQFLGHGQVYNSPSVVPHHVVPVLVNGERHWLYASDAKVYDVTILNDVAVHTNITPQVLGLDIDMLSGDNKMTSTVLGGIPILNPGNTSVPPMQWDLSGRMHALDNFPADTYCAVMRSYKNYLIALDVTKSGQNFPFLVKWSHPADPGGVPISWDITDPTVDAGEYDLASGHDHVIDGLALRDSFMIYKTNSIWRMDFVGGVFVFQFSKVLGNSGALNRNCVVETDGFHLVLTADDIILHDGYNSSSILNKKTRRWFFNHIDEDNVHRCFVFKNPYFNEVFVCYPEIGSTYCNKALVYNYVDRTVTFRDMPNVHHANWGQVEDGLTALWSQDDAPWSSDLTLWDSGGFVPSSTRVMLASNDNKLFLLDSSASFDGTIPDSYLERRGLSFKKDEQFKLIRSVRPRIDGNTGDTVKIQIGTQTDPNSEVEWCTEMDHVIGETISNDCIVSGRYIAIRFKTGTAYQWRLNSFDLDVELEGRW